MCLGFASTAHALTVINLDDVPHRVVFETNPGSKVIRSVEPGASVDTLQSVGVVYIEGKEHRVHIYGNDVLVIWGDGNIQIQKRRKINRNVF